MQSLITVHFHRGYIQPSSLMFLYSVHMVSDIPLINDKSGVIIVELLKFIIKQLKVQQWSLPEKVI